MRKRIIILVIGILLIGLTGSFTYMMLNAKNNQINAQQEQIYDLKNQLDVKTQTSSSTQEQLVPTSTGLDSERKAADDAIAAEFARKVLTWDNGKEYDEIRESIMADYDLTEESDFMQIFMHKYINYTQKNGVTLYYIDTHKINCQYEDLTSYVTNIKNNQYSYFAFVKFSTQDGTGNEGFGTAIMTYDIDADGKMTNIHGYTEGWQ